MLFQPDIAFVQAGWSNIYRHPNKQVLQTYRAHNIPVYNTAINGAMRIELNEDDTKPKLTCARSARKRYWHLEEEDVLQDRC